MTLYKAWRDSRARFTVSAGLLAAWCAVVVHLSDWALVTKYLQRFPFEKLVYEGYYHTIGPMFVTLMAGLLGLGGLRHEQHTGSVAFTLSLPVSRWMLLASRAGVGLAQVAVLAVGPAVLFPTLALLYGRSHPWLPLWKFAVLYMVWGAVFYSATFLLSVLRGETFLTATVCVLGISVYRIVMHYGFREWRWAGPMQALSGQSMPFLDETAGLFTGPVPWMHVGILAVISAGLLGLAAVITERQDF